MSTFNNKKQWLLITVITLVLMMSSIGSSKKHGHGEPKEEIDEAKSVLGRHILRFGEKILHSLITNEQQKNIIFSPLSIHSGVSLMSLGAKPGSAAADDIIKSLGYDNLSGTQAPIIEAHKAYAKIFSHFKTVTQASEQMKASQEDTGSIRPPVLDFWTMAVAGKQFKLKDSFVESATSYYNTSVKQVDKLESKQVANEINDWAKKAGFSDNELVKAEDLVPDQDVLNLMSAVRIQGWWPKSFHDHEVNVAFYNNGSIAKEGVVLTRHDLRDIKYAIFTNKQQDYDTEHVIQNSSSELKDLDFRMAEIPLYNDLKFVIVQPLTTNRTTEQTNIRDLESKLLVNPGSKLASHDKSLLKQALHHLKHQKSAHVNLLQIPQFRFEVDMGLKDTLTSIGLGRLFTREANLTNINPDGTSMYVKNAKHQAFIEVDKNGLKGGAFTRLQMVMMSAMIYRKNLDIILDRPFMFMVRYHGITLLMGHLNEI